MSRCRETTKMGAPARHRTLLAQARRAGLRATVPRYRGIGPEAYLNGTTPGELVLSLSEGTPEGARKDGHIIRARCAPLSPASGFPVSWS
jgi:hypothetical protein